MNTLAEYHKKLNMVCFDLATLRGIFEAPSRRQLLDYILESGEEPSEILKTPGKMKKIVDSYNLVKDKGDAEIFLAAYMMQSFFRGTKKVCFYMKDGFNPDVDSVGSLSLLKRSLKENHQEDFCLLADDGLRAFQVKAYRGDCSVVNFTKFLGEKLKHYGYNLGSTNFHITLQGTGEIEEDFFHQVHDYLKTLPIVGDGEIMVTYNEENKFEVLNTVFPSLSTVRNPYKPLSQRL